MHYFIFCKKIKPVVEQLALVPGDVVGVLDVGHVALVGVIASRRYHGVGARAHLRLVARRVPHYDPFVRCC